MLVDEQTYTVHGPLSVLGLDGGRGEYMLRLAIREAEFLQGGEYCWVYHRPGLSGTLGDLDTLYYDPPSGISAYQFRIVKERGNFFAETMWTPEEITRIEKTNESISKKSLRRTGPSKSKRILLLLG